MRRDNVFFLRVWRDATADSSWRASLEDLRSRRIDRFGDFGDLIAYLETRFGGAEEEER